MVSLRRRSMLAALAGVPALAAGTAPAGAGNFRVRAHLWITPAPFTGAMPSMGPRCRVFLLAGSWDPAVEPPPVPRVLSDERGAIYEFAGWEAGEGGTTAARYAMRHFAAGGPDRNPRMWIEGGELPSTGFPWPPVTRAAEGPRIPIQKRCTWLFSKNA